MKRKKANNKTTDKKIGFLSTKIVKNIKDNIRQRELLYEKYLEDNAISNVDPIVNKEFLLKGWSESVIHQNEIVRTVSEEFSFIINLKDAKKLVIIAALIGKEPYLSPIHLTLKINNKIVGKTELRYSHFFHYSFNIPKQLRKRNARVEGVIRKTDVSTEMGIRSISSYTKFMELESLQETVIDIQKMKRDTDHLLQVLDWHKNPEYLLPAEKSKKLTVKKIIKKSLLFLARPLINSDSLILKKIVLKMIRPFSTPQIIFNKHLTEILTLQAKRIEKLENLVISSIKISGNAK